MADASTDMDRVMTIEEDRDGYFIIVAPEDGSWRERRVVHIKKTEHGYSGFVPSMPGVRAAGDSMDAVRTALEQGVRDYVAARG